MQLGSLELQIFVALVLVLATAFVALVCDFLKGNNEQLRERNIELRVRHDERERMGLFEPLTHPVHWLQGLTALIRSAVTGEAPGAAAPSASAAPAFSAPAAEPDSPAPVSKEDLSDLTGGADRNPQRRHRYDEFKANAKTQSWATKEELEQLAGRAGRIRARHEASQKKPEPVQAPAAKPVESLKPALVPAAVAAPPLEFPLRAPAEQTPAVAEAQEIVWEAQEAESADSPVPAPWVFRPSEPESPAALAPEMQPPAVATEAEVAAEPEIFALESRPEAFAVEPPAETVTIAPEPVAEAAVEAPESVSVRSTEPVPLEMPAVRTRIQAIQIPTLEEAATEDLATPFETAIAAVPEPSPAAVIASPIEVVETQAIAVEPLLDVVALQKATGESRPAAAQLGEPEGKLDIPPGLHESGVLSLLIENQTPFSGVVVAIGLNDYETLREKLVSGADSAAALNKMVLSMLRPQDFACRFQEDEYILVYPGERGSSAQRRLFQVSEKLWDFQLRSLGNLSVMFSWGGLEVTNETLSEAVASARERMYQTKRNRKPAALDFAVSRKKVVNG